MAGKTLMPEYAGLARAVVGIDRQYGGEGRFIGPLLSIARTNLEMFGGMGMSLAGEILGRTLTQLAEVRFAGEDYRNPEIIAQVLNWAAQMPDRRQ